MICSICGKPLLPFETIHFECKFSENSVRWKMCGIKQLQQRKQNNGKD